MRLESLRRSFAGGDELPADALPSPILRSWQRCQRLGLEMGAKLQPDNSSRAGLMAARERNATLLEQASGVMQYLHEQIPASGSLILLADASGLILHGIGDPAFAGRASRHALQAGASWNESARGTNAIGASLVERMPVEILGAQHYLDCHGVLSCSAAPIFDWHGELLGALDISGDHRSHQPHTLALVRMGVRLVERQLFEREHARHALLAFHIEPEGVGGIQEGLLAIDSDGQIVAADPQAHRLLGMPPGRIGKLGAFARLFRGTFGAVVTRAARDPAARIELELRSGARIHVRLRLSPSWYGGRAPTSAPRFAAAPAAASAGSKRAQPRLHTLATGDPGLQFVLDRCARVIGRNIPILIQGETGSGKELLARACHFSGPRANGPFVAVNCAAIAENLIESELFGYIGGAFTDARRDGAIGLVQQAHGGTLFLDEIGDMPLAMQARLLRVLQERSVQPVGAASTVAVDFALLCATHRALDERIRAGLFREDLYYRVNGLAVRLPALRERSDLAQLVRRLLDASDKHPAAAEVRIDPQAMALLRACTWPGNIRQLQNVLEVALALLDEDDRLIRLEHLPQDLPLATPSAGGGVTAPKKKALFDARPTRNLDEDTIRAALHACGGNLSAAARKLGVARNTLYRRMGHRF